MTELIKCLQIEESDMGLVSLSFNKNAVNDLKPTNIVISQIVEYLNGSRRIFDIKLDLRGTEFQKNVWRALLDVAYGQTATYQQIANKIGQPNAVRAVANAIGANPIAIIIPCHRIIRSNGTFGDYRWGVRLKKRLLLLESRV
ncbi:MAG: methylated-DNA--[protein]-cysteine S-methyltransferase [Patescibacteria group bacterium]